MRKPKFPLTVTERGVCARIRKTSQTKNGTEYTLFVVDYSLLGKRKRESRSSLDEAMDVAKDACRHIAAGRQEALTLTNDDRLNYLRALEALEPLGLKLDLAAREYAECVRALAGRVSLAEACRDWIRRHSTDCPKKTIEEATNDCVKAQEDDGKSDERVKQLKGVFKQLAADLKMNLADVTPTVISQWLTGLKGAERSKRNFRDVLGFFCRWCVLRGYLPKGTDWLENVQNYSARKLSEIEIYTPGEVSRLLMHAGDMTPFIAIAAFAGLRHAEIDRLDWMQVDLVDGFIEVLAQNSKTGERRLVPMHENLKKWLEGYKQERGPVVGYSNTTKQLLKVAAKAGVKSRRNALRHSFISYRVAEIADVPRVSDEAGNSPAIIRQHYLRRVKPAQAAEWFGAVPPQVPQPTTAVQEVVAMAAIAA